MAAPVPSSPPAAEQPASSPYSQHFPLSASVQGFAPAAAAPQHRPLSHFSALAEEALIRWHLLSLDAPSVAALWVVLIARSAGVRLPWVAPVAMFLAVWMLYATDRLLDARDIRSVPARSQATHLELEARLLPGEGAARDSEPLLEERHYFHARHRTRFIAAIVLAAFFLGALLTRFSWNSLRLYCLLGSLLAGWLLLIHVRSRSVHPRDLAHPSRLPKELAVGLFFPAAVFIPTVALAPALRSWLLPGALLFAVVCSLNCLYIYAWEHPHAGPDAHGSTRWALSRLPRLSALGAALACTVTASALLSSRLQPWLPLLAAPALACALSLLGLWTLHSLRHRLTPVVLRAAADFTLLTPAILLPCLALLRAFR